MLSKRQSLSTTTILFRTTFTRTIKLNLLFIYIKLYSAYAVKFYLCIPFNHSVRTSDDSRPTQFCPVEPLFGKSTGRRPRWCGQPLPVVRLGRDGTSHGTYESRSCPLLLPTIRPHRISKWNTGRSFRQQQPKLKQIFNQPPIVSYS